MGDVAGSVAGLGQRALERGGVQPGVEQDPLRSGIDERRREEELRCVGADEVLLRDARELLLRDVSERTQLGEVLLERARARVEDVYAKEWAGAGVEKVQVVCPGFSADCLETLEEMNIQNRNLFMQAGGDRFTYIPALNDQPAHIDFLADLVCKHARGWLETEADYDRAAVRKKQSEAKQHALAMGETP